MKKFLLIATAVLMAANIQAKKVEFPQNQMPFANPYAFGLDLSFVQNSERRGTKYYDIDGTEKSPWQMFREHGYNWGRLMICNEPSSLGQDLAYVLAGAAKLKENNIHFALDFMMSNGWSNPMTQPTPKEWKEMSHKERVTALYDYVYHVITSLRDAGVMPEIIQVGNEIGNGMLWPDGRVFYGDERRDESHWKELCEYINAGAKAIRKADTEGKAQIMLHVDFGGDLEMSDIFCSKMEKYHVDYDMIGFSFYPWSHGTLMDLRDNLYYTIKKFGKPIMVIETGYYSTPSNSFERKGYKSAYPETPEGQMQWFQAVNEIVMAAPDNMGRGVFWWEPMQRGRGFFDDRTNTAKPIISAFEKYAWPVDRYDGNPRIWDFDEK